MTATLTYTNASTEDVTGAASWVSDDPAVATVDSAGLVSAVGEGTATITATHSGLSDTCLATVPAP
ncbi:Ig-like domain-containing protein [Nocardiopsis sp. FR26]|uniref:Ig-like domain-containing protein n=1 Tax=Nocardiopsis sp. FR26 TaxID=2605987 RepID=UPI001F4749E2|nr:Ig-like domain-containing protein [Nocardiopsis sp. FR26]